MREESPDTVRVLLTGHAELDSAIAAINEGQIFRFLIKPCPPDVLRNVVATAAEQHRLITTEKVLLEQTLRGSVKTLIDVLSLCSPTAFGKATRIRDFAAAILAELGGAPTWQLEVAAMLSQLGTVVLPEATLENYFRGRELSDDDVAMVGKAASLPQQLLANIPRLEAVAEWVAELNRPQPTPGTTPPGHWAKQCIELKILRVASDFDRLELSGLSQQNAIDILRGRAGWYDETCLDALARATHTRTRVQTLELEVSAIAPGMTLVGDVRATTGVLILASGHRLTEGSVQRLRNFPKGAIAGPIRVSEK
jgi:response regulator RpfG family c-di-GMP phosphodiesterase